MPPDSKHIAPPTTAGHSPDAPLGSGPGPGPGSGSGLGLGLDAGGTQTRWALARADGQVLAEGAVAPISGLQLAQAGAREALKPPLLRLAAALGAWPAPQGVVAGLTGFDPASTALWCELAAGALGLQPRALRVLSDIELACRAAFEPGHGIVVYAGTGSIAAHLDAQGTLQRSGGRGAVIDDAGGGHWIARQALQQIWRGEDAEPGCWPRSAMARQVFRQIGGSDWPQCRAWVYGASRGELGLLALAVAAAADEDPAALALLRQAGQELGRLARTLLQRVGPQPVALAGRVFDLHPAVTAALRVTLEPDTQATRLTVPAHHAAARLAACLLDSP